VDGWYVSHAKKHYRITREAQILQSAKTLATVLLHPTTKNVLTPENNTALRSLVNIFNTYRYYVHSFSTAAPRRSARRRRDTIFQSIHMLQSSLQAIFPVCNAVIHP